MRTRLIKNLVLEKKRKFGISLTLAWQLYFLETLIKKIVKSRFGDKVVFGGNLVDRMLYGGEYTESLKIYLGNVALNKFNVSRWFKEILVDTKWEIDDIRLIDSLNVRTYKVELLCQEKDWEQVISMEIIERKMGFPESMIMKFEGLYYNDFLIKTYSIGDLIADSFVKFMFFNDVNSLEKINMIYKKIIVNDMELKQSLKRVFLTYKMNLDKEVLLLKKDEIWHDTKMQKLWEKSHDVPWVEMMILVEGIIELL